jgi:hypothetical protein
VHLTATDIDSAVAVDAVLNILPNEFVAGLSVLLHREMPVPNMQVNHSSSNTRGLANSSGYCL